VRLQLNGTNDRPGDRREDRRLGADAPLLLESGNFIVGAAEDAQPVARRLERGLGRAQVVLRRTPRRAASRWVCP
jgi:hypothetical protein